MLFQIFSLAIWSIILGTPIFFFLSINELYGIIITLGIIALPLFLFGFIETSSIYLALNLLLVASDIYLIIKIKQAKKKSSEETS